MDWRTWVFLAAVVVTTLCAYMFLEQYFRTYYKLGFDLQVYSLESGWEYETERTPRSPLRQIGAVRPGEIGAGEALTLYRSLNTVVDEATLLIRTKHQDLWVLLDGELLYESVSVPTGRDPGVALHFVQLPGDYAGRELALRFVSPYNAYSGRVGNILMGPVIALETTLFARALRPVLFMAISLFLGFCTIGLAFAQGLQGIRQWKYLAIGTFAVDWGVYYLCNEGIVLHFFTPAQASIFSLGCYYFMQVPLSIFFYQSLERHRKYMAPLVGVHCLFVTFAFLLQALGLLDFPELIHVNNALIGGGLLYTLVLCMVEVGQGNRYLWVPTPFLLVAWGFTMLDYAFFYFTRRSMSYLFLDPYFILILAVLSHSIWQFFRQYYQERREAEVVAVRGRAAIEGYEMEREHNRRLRELKHEFNKHMGALQLYVGYEKYEEAYQYLQRISGDYADIPAAAYSDNLLVNAAVGRMLRAAESLGIHVELHMEGLGELRVNDADLFSLLGNILDNALEACETVPEGGDRYIQFSIRRREPYLYMVCTNSRSGDMLQVGDVFHSTKPNPEQHGYGLHIVRQIVETYDGMMDIEYTDDAFIIELAIKVAQRVPAFAEG